MHSHIPQSISTSLDQFVGRDWVIPQIAHWLTNTDERLFLITGQPGTGKSMLLSWLAGYGPPPSSEETKRLRERVCAHVHALHFCVARSRTVIPQLFVQELVNQLSHSIPGYTEKVLESGERHIELNVQQTANTIAPGGSMIGVQLRIGGQGAEYSFAHLVCDPLTELYDGGYTRPILLVIDALDEALTYRNQLELDIPELLTRLHDMPPNIRVIASTRPVPRILQNFGHYGHLDLDQKLDVQQDDISQYISSRLVPSATSNIDVVTREATERAAGNFLFARYLIDHLLSHGDGSLPNTAHLPGNLAEIYWQFLAREIGTREENWTRLLAPVLGILSVVQGDGFSRKQLQNILNIDIDHALRICRQFLSTPSAHGPFRIYHGSFVEFLCNDSNNTDFYIDPAVYHELITNYYFRTYGRNWVTCDPYGLSYLTTHLASSSNNTVLIELLTATPDWMNAKYAIFHNDLSLTDDIRVAQQALTPHTNSSLIDYVRLSFLQVLTGIRSRAFEDYALSTLVHLGKAEEALAHVRTRIGVESQIDALCACANAYSLSEAKGKALKLFEEAYILAARLEDKSKRVHALCGIASYLAKFSYSRAVELVEEVRELLVPELEAIGDDDYGPGTGMILDYVLALAGIGRVDEIVEVFEQISTRSLREDERNGMYIAALMARVKAALWLSSRQETDQAKLIAADVLREWKALDPELPGIANSVMVLSILARLYFSFGDRDSGRSLTQNAYKSAETASRLVEKYSALVQVVGAIASGGYFDWAEAIVKEIDSPEYKVEAYIGMAIEATKGDNSNYENAQRLTEKAAANAVMILDAYEKWRAWGQIAWSFARAGNSHRASESVEVARTLGLSLFDESEQVDTLDTLATLYGKERKFDLAIKLAELIQSVKIELGSTTFERHLSSFTTRTYVEKLKLSKRLETWEGMALLLSINPLATRGGGEQPYIDDYEETICTISKYMARAGEPHRAHQLTEAVLGSVFADGALREIAVQYVRQGNLDSATEIVSDQIRFTHEKAIACAEIAEASWQVNDHGNFVRFFNAAVRGIEQIQDVGYECQIILNLCRILTRTGHPADAAEWFHEIETRIERHYSSFVGEEFRSEIVEDLLSIDLPGSDELIEKLMADTLDLSRDKDGLIGKWHVMRCCKIAELYIQLGKTEKAKQIMDDILAAEIESFDVHCVSASLASLGETGLAVEVIRKHLDFQDENIIESLISVAEAVSRSRMVTKENRMHLATMLLAFIPVYNPSIALRLLAGFSPLLSSISTDLPLSAISQAIEIISWERPSWAKLYSA